MNTRMLAVPIAVLAAAAALLAPPAYASCLPATAAEQRARADVIFRGTALEGPTATGVQRFRVGRWLKGTGPSVVRVQTGNRRSANGGGSITSVSIVVRRGERWQVYARGNPRRVLDTSVCDGSRRV